MTKIVPTLPDAHIVRTYPRDYADTDTESEGEAPFEVETEDEEKNSISNRNPQKDQYQAKVFRHLRKTQKTICTFTKIFWPS